MKKESKVFKFSGMGNYSRTFGWDNGLSCSIERELSIDEARKIDYENCDSESFAVTGNVLGESLEEGVYPFFYNEYNGSRNVSGFVVAYSLEEAQKIVDSWAACYPVIEYVE